MQIVIDILDETYEHLTPKEPKKMTNKDALNWFIVLHKAIFVNGKVLPKGHGRLIDADAVEKEMNKSEVEADRNADYYTADKIDCAMEYIINAPTIIEADKEVDE